MSTESVKQFWQQALTDQNLRAKVQANPTGNKIWTTTASELEKRIGEVVKIAAEAGFTFTIQDYQAAVKEELGKQHAAAELRPEDLAKVAGVGPGDVFRSDSISCCTNTSSSCSPAC